MSRDPKLYKNTDVYRDAPRLRITRKHGNIKLDWGTKVYGITMMFRDTEVHCIYQGVWEHQAV